MIALDSRTPPGDVERYIEEVGLFMERSGATRMFGRVLAWLLIAVPPLQTAEELMAALHVSRGAISTTVRQLMDAGFVERVRLPGQRRDYFRTTPEVWAQLLRPGVARYGHLRQLAERGLLLLRDQPPETRQRLEAMRDLCIFIEQRLPTLFAEWEAQWQARHDPPDAP